MPDRFDLTYELTRADWIAVSEACFRESPEWKQADANYRRALQNQAFWFAPLVVVSASLMIGRDHGMYLEGAGLGLLFALFLYFALPRVKGMCDTKERARRDVAKMDYSPHVGRVTVAATVLGVNITAPGRDVRLSWEKIAPSAVTGFTILQDVGGGTTLIPARAFESEAAAREFQETVMQWWRAMQRPLAERLRSYLADRDAPCPACNYNLRGLAAEHCPECGAAINFNELAKP